MQKLQQEILKEITREDGLLNIEKYDHELIEGIIKRAYTAGLKRAIEVLPPEEDFTPCLDQNEYDNNYVEHGFNKCREEAITNITKEMK